jgi:hypothetical protein
VYQRDIHFFAFPIFPVLGIILCMIVGIIVAIRVRKKLKEQYI